MKISRKELISTYNKLEQKYQTLNESQKKEMDKMYYAIREGFSYDLNEETFQDKIDAKYGAAKAAIAGVNKVPGIPDEIWKGLTPEQQNLAMKAKPSDIPDLLDAFMQGSGGGIRGKLGEVVPGASIAARHAASAIETKAQAASDFAQHDVIGTGGPLDHFMFHLKHNVGALGKMFSGDLSTQETKELLSKEMDRLHSDPFNMASIVLPGIMAGVTLVGGIASVGFVKAFTNAIKDKKIQGVAQGAIDKTIDEKSMNYHNQNKMNPKYAEKLIVSLIKLSGGVESKTFKQALVKLYGKATALKVIKNYKSFKTTIKKK